MSEQLNLFAPPARPVPPRPTFDPLHHPCAVCGAPDAAFGHGWPDELKFYCREHEAARHAIAAQDDQC
jgi:hypothetical protein